MHFFVIKFSPQNFTSKILIHTIIIFKVYNLSLVIHLKYYIFLQDFFLNTNFFVTEWETLMVTYPFYLFYGHR